MENKLNTYGEGYANLYIEKTMKRPYTIIKNQLILHTTTRLTQFNHLKKIAFLDIGGNVNAIVQGGLADLIEDNIKDSVYYTVDLDRYYFAPNLKGKAEDGIFKKTNSLHATVGNGERLPFRHNFTDVVLVADVLEHVSNPEAVIKESRRVLKPNGYVHLITPALYKLDAIKPLIPKTKLIDSLIDLNGHINFFDKKIIDDMLIKHNFKITDTIGVGFALSMQFLLWFNSDYIPQNYFNIKTDKEKLYRSVSNLINKLSPDIVQEIDIVLNSTRLLNTFINKFILNPKKHPLSSIYEILKLSNDYGKNEEVDQIYKELRDTILPVTKIISANKLRKNIFKYIKANNPLFLANSVLNVAQAIYE